MKRYQDRAEDNWITWIRTWRLCFLFEIDQAALAHLIFPSRDSECHRFIDSRAPRLEQKYLGTFSLSKMFELLSGWGTRGTCASDAGILHLNAQRSIKFISLVSSLPLDSVLVINSVQPVLWVPDNDARFWKGINTNNTLQSLLACYCLCSWP